MSRIGKKPIQIPDGVTVMFQNEVASVKGPKGELSVPVISGITVKDTEGTLLVERSSDERKFRANHGTLRQLMSNAVIGVSQGYKKELTLVGVGYQAQMDGIRLKLALGYSHDIIFEPPKGITISAKRTEITVEGIDKQLVGEVAAKIRSFRKPEPYKGKGVRYKGEYVRQKQGKTVGG
ncbi:MAG: 50S ribosomal protein L6 [Candidatus Marinimicrobia bacterium]|nr:50S ribosomal protein L6 [Candidatus Neomarinimicrobiota bacterium]MBL7059636.1 50S ribosomal protein L6 [Candidatus Neomarinimicrobiota bacterium]